MKQAYQFTISRTDRIYFIVFILILLSWELFKYFMPKTKLIEVSETTHVMEINKTENTVAFPPSEKGTNPNQTKEKSHTLSSTSTNPETAKDRVPINIMQASKEELQAIGLSQQVAFNITRYIEAGGQIKNRDDALKIYGMDTAQWNVVSDYILFPKKEEIKITENKYDPNRFLPKRILDLNTASAIELDSLPGIGPVFAERIIQLRKNLGGFLFVDQLESCYGLPPETIERILPMVTIKDPAKPRNANEIDWATFYHPYLNKKFGAMIAAYKKNHGPFSTVEEFRKVFPPDTNWCNALLPYLSFGTED